MRRRATSYRSVVTAAKLVYSTWKFTQPGERNGKALYRNRPASEPVHVLHSIGEREDIRHRVGAGGFDAVCEEAAGQRRSCGRDHVQHAVILRRGEAACGARGGGGHKSVSRHQQVGKETPPHHAGTL